MEQSQTENQKLETAITCTAKARFIKTVKKITSAFKPTTEDLNYSRWEELEFRNHKQADQFNQVHDRRFK